MLRNYLLTGIRVDGIISIYLLICFLWHQQQLDIQRLLGKYRWKVRKIVPALRVVLRPCGVATERLFLVHVEGEHDQEPRNSQYRPRRPVSSQHS